MSTPGALPLYLQISELLIRDIAAGRLIDGERLPPEREMAAGLGIAVGTLRQALQALAAKGLVERIQGSGNYIRAKADPASVYALFRLELLTGGGLPTARVLSVDRLAKDPALPAFGKSPDAHRIRRLRLLSGVVAAVEEIWLDGAPKTGSAWAPCPLGPRRTFPAPAAPRCQRSPASARDRTASRSKPRSPGMTLTAWPMWPA